MKYDKMVAIVQEESNRKVRIAKKALTDMMNKNEKVTVSALVLKTGLSRGFFYKNPVVRIELDYAKRKQDETYHGAIQGVVDDDLESLIPGKDAIKIQLLNNELIAINRKLEQDNEKLRKEIARLHKQLQRKEVSILKTL